MCGICGVVAPGREADPELVTAMLSRLTHRGPDGLGRLLDHGAVLGHARLSIIDVAGGAQPLGNEDGSVWVTFNGEIFNYLELAEQLRRLGHRFRSRSDTEVVVHAWEQWGEGCFDRFNGQWALAIWDRSSRTLILSRDRMGILPLYYHLRPGRIAFASEIKALFADPGIPRALDPAGLDQVFTLWSTRAPLTAFAGIRQLPPGHVGRFDADGFRSAPYWSPRFPARGEEPNQDLRENAARLRELLVQAVRLRFERSDFPVGAYLSGGLDSSVTAAAIRNFTSADLDTFSLRFADEEFDESQYQRLMAERLGTRHHEVEVSGADIARVFPDVVRGAETPLLRTAPAPLFLLSLLVRGSGFRVVVTGEGSDEVLGGYDIYREAKVREFWARDPDSELRTRAAELLYPWLARNPALAPAFARGFFGQHLDLQDPGLSHRPRWLSTAAVKTLLTREAQDWLAAAAPADPTLDMPAGHMAWDSLSRSQWLEYVTLLPGYILAAQGDRMLMAHSVEGRFPFLDPDVVDFAATIPARHKLFGLEEKFILKRAFADLVPAEVLNRPKQPYRAPDAASFFGPGRETDWVADVVSARALAACGLFDAAQVAGLMRKARDRGPSFGNTDNMRVVAVLSTQLLHAQFIAEPWPQQRVAPEATLTVDLVAGGQETP